MDKNEWYKVGEDIRDQVQAAIDSGDFSQLGRNIGESVNRAVDDVSRSISESLSGRNPYAQRKDREENSENEQEVIYTQDGQEVVEQRTGRKEDADECSYKQGYDKQGYYKQNSSLYKRPNTRPDVRLFERSPRGSVSGILYMVFGYLMSGCAGLFFLGIVIAMLAGFEMGMAGTAMIGVSTAFLAAGVGMGAYGTKLRGRAKRYRKYVDAVKEKLYCSIEELAEKTGKGEKFIRKDLKKMLQLGMFKQGHLDSKETCLIASDEVYEQYQQTQEKYEQERRQAEEEKKHQAEKILEQEAVGVREVIEEGQSYIRLIRRCNDEIPGEEMSDKLDQLELLVTRIFDQVEKEPELAPELRKMLSYYLPTTQKLLEVYRDLDRQQVELANVAGTKKEIEAAVDTINEAFAKFLDDLFRDTAWDVQSDISVLHTMLKQDGYLKKDFGA